MPLWQSNAAGYKEGYVYGSGGHYAVAYNAGDTVTVTLNLDASTVGFRMNGEAIGAQPIPQEPYHFAFDAYRVNNAVTIMLMI